MSADFLKLTEPNGDVVNIRMDTVRVIRRCAEEDCPENGDLLVLYDWLDMTDPRRPVSTIKGMHVQDTPGLLEEETASGYALSNLQPPTSIFAKPAQTGVQEAYYNGRGALMGVLKGQPFLMADPPADWEDADIVEVHGMTADKILLKHQKSDVTAWHDMLREDTEPERDLGNLLPPASLLTAKVDTERWNVDAEPVEDELTRLRRIVAEHDGHTH